MLAPVQGNLDRIELLLFVPEMRRLSFCWLGGDGIFGVSRVWYEWVSDRLCVRGSHPSSCICQWGEWDFFIDLILLATLWILTRTCTYIPPPSTTCWYIHPPCPATHPSHLLHHFPTTTLSGINTPHTPSPVILHRPAYKDGTDREFRNIGY